MLHRQSIDQMSGFEQLDRLWALRVWHNEPIAKAVERIKTVERLVKQKIVVTQSRGKWRISVRDDAQVVERPSERFRQVRGVRTFSAKIVATGTKKLL
jgi:predicted RNA-binding protein with RPS1 domain